MSFLSNLEGLLTALHISGVQFAKEINASPSLMTEIRKGRSKSVSSTVLDSIYRRYNVNINWLLTGEGEMFLSSPQGGYTPLPDPTAQLKGKDKDVAREFIEYLGDKPKIKQYKENKQEFEAWLREKKPASLPKISTPLEITVEGDIKLLPIQKTSDENQDDNVIHMLGNIAAGRPINVEGTKQESYTIVKDYWRGIQGPFFLVRAKGDSMIEARICDGDLLVVISSESPSFIGASGQIVVALLDGEATVKYFVRDGTNIWLKPANKKYQPIQFKPSMELLIQGQVIGKAKVVD